MDESTGPINIIAPRGRNWQRLETGDVRRSGQQFRTGVFLPGDTVMPDTVSKHLMESGDIESNPGPDECGVCGSHRMKKPTECSQCRRSYCKTDCIGPRWKTDKLIKEGKPLICRICKGEKVSKKHPFNEGIEPDKCAGKRGRKQIRKTDDFLECIKCRKQYHKGRSAQK